MKILSIYQVLVTLESHIFFCGFWPMLSPGFLLIVRITYRILWKYNLIKIIILKKLYQNFWCDWPPLAWDATGGTLVAEARTAGIWERYWPVTWTAGRKWHATDINHRISQVREKCPENLLVSSVPKLWTHPNFWWFIILNTSDLAEVFSIFSP
jgi:hypothetical protein